MESLLWLFLIKIYCNRKLRVVETVFIVNKKLHYLYYGIIKYLSCLITVGAAYNDPGCNNKENEKGQTK